MYKSVIRLLSFHVLCSLLVTIIHMFHYMSYLDLFNELYNVTFSTVLMFLTNFPGRTCLCCEKET